MEQSRAIALAYARRRRTAVQITERDRELLAFVGRHQFVLAAHVAVLLGTSEQAAAKRLGALAKANYLTSEPVLHGRPRTYRSTRKGLDLVGSRMRVPKVDVAKFDHEIGAAWLWLAARAGAFGQIREVLAERELRSHDARAELDQPPHGVRLGGSGPHGRERLHYPDLVVVDADGRRIAVELELSSKGRARRERILAGYASDTRVGAVLYLARGPQLARSIRESAARLGCSRLIQVGQLPAAVPVAAGGRELLRHSGRPAAPRSARETVMGGRRSARETVLGGPRSARETVPEVTR
jgi:hypothetical protein